MVGRLLKHIRSSPGLIYDKEILNKVSEIPKISEQDRKQIENLLENLRKDLDTNYGKIGKQIQELEKLARNLCLCDGFEDVSSDYFEKYTKNIEEDFQDWKNGMDFRSLSSIYQEKEFRRNEVITTIKEGLDKYKMLLIKGEPGTSKNTLYSWRLFVIISKKITLYYGIKE